MSIVSVIWFYLLCSVADKRRGYAGVSILCMIEAGMIGAPWGLTQISFLHVINSVKRVGKPGGGSLNEEFSNLVQSVIGPHINYSTSVQF